MCGGGILLLTQRTAWTTNLRIAPVHNREERKNRKRWQKDEKGAMVKQLAWHQLPHKDVRVSLSSGQKSHTQVFCWSILDSCPRVRRPQKQAADPPQAGLNWDSGSQVKLPLSSACPLGRVHKASENLHVSIPVTRRASAPRQCQPENHRPPPTERTICNSSDVRRECSTFCLLLLPPGEARSRREGKRRCLEPNDTPDTCTTPRNHAFSPSGVQLKDGTR